MNFSANLFLGIAALLFLGLLNLIYGSHNRSGDAGVGFAWVIMITLSGFVICMAIVTLIIGMMGGFAWVGQTGTQRFWFVLAGFLISMWGVVFFSMGEGTGGLPFPLRYVMKTLPVLTNLSVLVGAFLLLNESIRTSLPPLAWRLPIYISLCIGLIPVGFSLVRKVSRTVGVYVNIPASRKADIDRQLAQIEATDLMKDGVFLYGDTDANKPKPVREAALAKIKSRPDWQEEMVRRLQNDWAPEAFTFLASNEVDNKAMFTEPVRQGVLIQARLIRENIRACRDEYSLYASKYNSEVDRVLRTVDKFEGLGVDYRPAVQELRNAMDEPVDFEKPKLMAIKPLDKWLEKH